MDLKKTSTSYARMARSAVPKFFESDPSTEPVLDETTDNIGTCQTMKQRTISYCIHSSSNNNSAVARKIKTF